jgi:hypothetical protein
MTVVPRVGLRLIGCARISPAYCRISRVTEDLMRCFTFLVNGNPRRELPEIISNQF